MQIFSGSCCLCDVGIKTGEVDIDGNELFTGDIVQLWHGAYLDTECEEWMPSSGITAIVANQYQSFCDGTIKEVDREPEPFTMGIKNVGIQGAEWKVSLVKSHKDIVEGERFISYGFNFRKAKVKKLFNKEG